MKFTELELTVIKAAINRILLNKNGRIHYDYSIIEIDVMQKIASMLYYKDYCEEFNIEYEDMTEEDKFNAHEWLEERRSKLYVEEDC